MTTTDVYVMAALEIGRNTVEGIVEVTGFQHIAVVVSCELMARDGLVIATCRGGYYPRPRNSTVVRAGDCQ